MTYITAFVVPRSHPVSPADVIECARVDWPACSADARLKYRQEKKVIKSAYLYVELITIQFNYGTFFFVLFLIEQDHVVMAIQTVKRDCAALAVTVKPSVNAN